VHTCAPSCTRLFHGLRLCVNERLHKCIIKLSPSCCYCGIVGCYSRAFDARYLCCVCTHNLNVCEDYVEGRFHQAGGPLLTPDALLSSTSKLKYQLPQGRECGPEGAFMTAVKTL